MVIWNTNLSKEKNHKQPGISKTNQGLQRNIYKFAQAYSKSNNKKTNNILAVLMDRKPFQVQAGPE